MASTPTSPAPARRRPSGKHVLLAYLPPAEAVVGNELAVWYMEELYPVTVGSVDITPIFDPDNDRIR